MQGPLMFGMLSLFITFIVCLACHFKLKKQKKYYETYINELIYSSDFSGLKRIETIANIYKDFNKENKKETSKLKLAICCDILDKVEFCKAMRTTTLASVPEVAKKVENMEAVSVENKEIKQKKSKKEVVE